MKQPNWAETNSTSVASAVALPGVPTTSPSAPTYSYIWLHCGANSTHSIATYSSKTDFAPAARFELAANPIEGSQPDSQHTATPNPRPPDALTDETRLTTVLRLHVLRWVGAGGSINHLHSINQCMCIAGACIPVCRLFPSLLESWPTKRGPNSLSLRTCWERKSIWRARIQSTATYTALSSEHSQLTLLGSPILVSLPLLLFGFGARRTHHAVAASHVQYSCKVMPGWYNGFWCPPESRFHFSLVHFFLVIMYMH